MKKEVSPTPDILFVSPNIFGLRQRKTFTYRNFNAVKYSNISYQLQGHEVPLGKRALKSGSNVLIGTSII